MSSKAVQQNCWIRKYLLLEINITGLLFYRDLQSSIDVVTTSKFCDRIYFRYFRIATICRYILRYPRKSVTRKINSFLLFIFGFTFVFPAIKEENAHQFV